MSHGKWVLVGIGLFWVFSSFPTLADDVYQVNLVPCNQALCGPSTELSYLREGEVEITEEGNVKVEIEGSNLLNSLTYTVFFQPISTEATPPSPIFVGSLVPDEEGNAEEEIGVLSVVQSMGWFYIADEFGKRYFATGFATSPKPGDDGDDDDDEGDDEESCDKETDNDCDDLSNEEDDDDDNDGIKDDDDLDDDNDGVPDDSDVDPDSANIFDGVKSSTELKQVYREKVRTQKRKLNAEVKNLKRASKEDRKAVKSFFRDRRKDPDLR